MNLALEAIFIIIECIVAIKKSPEGRRKGDLKKEAISKKQEIRKIKGLWNC